MIRTRARVEEKSSGYTVAAWIEIVCFAVVIGQGESGSRFSYEWMGHV